LELVQLNGTFSVIAAACQWQQVLAVEALSMVYGVSINKIHSLVKERSKKKL
jgi:hypothetical protein